MQPSSPDDFDGSKAKANKKTLKIVGAAVAAVVAIVLGITLASGDDESTDSTSLTTLGPFETIALVPEDTDETAAVEPLPAVCDVLAPADVGQIVGGRTMTAAPMPAGNGCLFTSDEEPNIDLTTAYPPFIQQVSLTYNAPQPGLTAEDIAALYESSRGTSVDIPGPPGGVAYSNGGGEAVVLDNGVMIICSTSGITRPESIPEIQAMCITIASLLRAELP